MGKGKKADVQFILPEAAPEFEDLAIEDEDEFEEPPYTSIEHSVASGEGLYTAMSKCKASFDITAYDGKGVRRPYGGDPFAVSVRGASYVYAKVIDNNDGSYKVEYKPSTSGQYTIAITLAGRSMPGSPFALTVLVPRADPSRCTLRGACLNKVVARHASSFEVEFADAFGQVAHAEELDVYVESRPEPAVEDETASPDVLVWAIVVAPTTLMVREGPELDSKHIGDVAPGAMVGVVETLDVGGGSRRARIIYNVGAGRAGAAPGIDPITPRSSRAGSPFSTPGRSTPGRNTPVSSARGLRPASPGRGLSPGRSPRAGSPRRGAMHMNSPFGSARGLDNSAPLTDRSQRGSARGRPIVPTFMPGALTRKPEQCTTGWVTAAKDGKETVVLRHAKLDASRRQEQMKRWASQLAAENNRKAAEQQARGEDLRSARSGPSCAHELISDKAGIAFAYGGVDPGTLHAHGKLIKTHTVHFSVGKAGRYLMHVGLRNQKASLPGSPFELEVAPGPAHAVSTSLPVDKLPLEGTVGELGSVRMVTCDKMGNLCVVGDAPVKVDTKSNVLQTSTVDNGDGSYDLQWHGEVSGKYEVLVTIDGINVTCSPTQLTLLPASPDVSKCVVSGSGLNDAVAGDPVLVKVLCKDRFSNPTLPGVSLSFGLAIAPPSAVPEKADKKDKKDSKKDKDGEKAENSEKEDKKSDQGACTLPSISFDGTWLAEGEYEIKYVAENAGDYELHLWCDTDGNGVRQKMPGSPFPLHVTAASASAGGSLVLGGEQYAENPLMAGDRLEFGIQLRDPYGNPCAAPVRARGASAAVTVKEVDDENALPTSPTLGSRRTNRRQSGPGLGDRDGNGGTSGKASSIGTKAMPEKDEGVTAWLVTPTDKINMTDKLRSGDSLGSFTLSHELHIAGNYEAHLTLSGSSITGSPILFEVKPAAPSGRLSTLQIPEKAPHVHEQYELLLIAEDKYSNKLDRGGASVQARALGPSASPATTFDYENGTYGVRFTAGAVGEYRVEVRLDNVKIKGSPLVIMFTEGKGGPKPQVNAPASAEIEYVDDAEID